MESPHGTGIYSFILFFSHASTFQLLDKPWSQVSSVLPPGSRLKFLSRVWVQHSHCSSIFPRMLLTHALARSASQLEHKKKSQRIYTSMHSAGLELTKLTHTRLEDNLIRHRGDRIRYAPAQHIGIIQVTGTIGKRATTESHYGIERSSHAARFLRLYREQ